MIFYNNALRETNSRVRVPRSYNTRGQYNNRWNLQSFSLQVKRVGFEHTGVLRGVHSCQRATKGDGNNGEGSDRAWSRWLKAYWLFSSSELGVYWLSVASDPSYIIVDLIRLAKAESCTWKLNTDKTCFCAFAAWCLFAGSNLFLKQQPRRATTLSSGFSSWTQQPLLQWQCGTLDNRAAVSALWWQRAYQQRPQETQNGQQNPIGFRFSFRNRIRRTHH